MLAKVAAAHHPKTSPSSQALVWELPCSGGQHCPQGSSLPATLLSGYARLQRVVRCSQRLQVRQVAKPRRECTVEAEPCTHQPSPLTVTWNDAAWLPHRQVLAAQHAIYAGVQHARCMRCSHQTCPGARGGRQRRRHSVSPAHKGQRSHASSDRCFSYEKASLYIGAIKSSWTALRASQKSRKTVWFGGGLMSSHAPHPPEQHLRSHAADAQRRLLGKAQHGSVGFVGTCVAHASSTTRACARLQKRLSRASGAQSTAGRQLEGAHCA